MATISAPDYSLIDSGLHSIRMGRATESTKNSYYNSVLALKQDNFLLKGRKNIMVLGIITSIAACPAIIGTTEAVRQGQRQNAREQHRGRKSNLLVSCSDPSRKARDINGGTVVLRNNKVRNPTTGL